MSDYSGPYSGEKRDPSEAVAPGGVHQEDRRSADEKGTLGENDTPREEGSDSDES